MKNALLPLLLLGTLALFAGCSSPNVGAGLQLELGSIERTADGGATATVRIVNPNMVAYNVATGVHTLSLGNGYTGTLTIRKPVGIPAQSTGLHTGPLVAGKGAALVGGETSYQLESRVELTLWDDQKEDLKQRASGTVTVK